MKFTSGVVLGIAVTSALGCGSNPTPTGTTCEDPNPVTGTTQLTWDNFGRDFMVKYCVNCHSSDLPRSQRNGAPIYHDFDTLVGVLQVADHIDEQAGLGPNAHNTFMPGDRCPAVKGGPLAQACSQPTKQERVDLAQWLTCERLRPH